MIQQYELNGQKIYLYEWQWSWLKGFFAGQQNIIDNSLVKFKEIDKNLDSLSVHTNELCESIDSLIETKRHNFSTLL